jgi:DNA-binding Lrp family transcriptional regulator
MVLTRRDLDIINFLEDNRIASTSTLNTLFFPSLSACQKRMKTLFDNKRVKRARLMMNYDYIYYVNKPKKVMHDLLVTEFYNSLMKQRNVLQFRIDKELGKIRPDAIFVYEKDGKQQLGLLEVEISHKGFNYQKYETFYKSGSFRTWFPVMPTVYVVCQNAKLPKDGSINFIKVKTDMSDLKL